MGIFGLFNRKEDNMQNINKVIAKFENKVDVLLSNKSLYNYIISVLDSYKDDVTAKFYQDIDIFRSYLVLSSSDCSGYYMFELIIEENGDFKTTIETSLTRFNNREKQNKKIIIGNDNTVTVIESTNQNIVQRGNDGLILNEINNILENKFYVDDKLTYKNKVENKCFNIDDKNITTFEEVFVSKEEDAKEAVAKREVIAKEEVHGRKPGTIYLKSYDYSVPDLIFSDRNEKCGIYINGFSTITEDEYNEFVSKKGLKRK